LKRYEIESCTKSFLLFASLFLLLLGFITFGEYHLRADMLNANLNHKMDLCSYKLDCKEYKVDFIKKDKSRDLQKLYIEGDEVYSLYKVPTVDDYYLKLFISKKKYELKRREILLKIFKENSIYILFVILLSYLFSRYSLSPIKKALKINEEFIKDILHDFNTPISSMVINLKMLKKDSKNLEIVKRLEVSIDTILALQENFKLYLNNSKLQREKVELKPLIKDRVDSFKVIYKSLDFKLNLENVEILTNKDAFIRIIDNLISNACKYNSTNGKVLVELKDNFLIISDSGKGIKNPSKVFDRFYKESDRGLGIGMHIVKKLCDELDLNISIKSSVNEGTSVTIDLSKVIVK